MDKFAQILSRMNPVDSLRPLYEPRMWTPRPDDYAFQEGDYSDHVSASRPKRRRGMPQKRLAAAHPWQGRRAERRARKRHMADFRRFLSFAVLRSNWPQARLLLTMLRERHGYRRDVEALAACIPRLWLHGRISSYAVDVELQQPKQVLT